MEESYTAISIPLVEAMFLQPFRTKHISTPAITMPPHVSKFGPFYAIKEMTPGIIQSLKDVLESFSPFRFALQETGRFSSINVLYLLPKPASPFLALHHAISTKFPELSPNFPDPVMHLTLARVDDGELDQVEAEFHQEYGKRLPIEATASEVGLYEKQDGVWHQRMSFELRKCLAISEY